MRYSSIWRGQYLRNLASQGAEVLYYTPARFISRPKREGYRLRAGRLAVFGVVAERSSPSAAATGLMSSASSSHGAC